MLAEVKNSERMSPESDQHDEDHRIGCIGRKEAVELPISTADMIVVTTSTLLNPAKRSAAGPGTSIPMAPKALTEGQHADWNGDSPKPIWNISGNRNGTDPDPIRNSALPMISQPSARGSSAAPGPASGAADFLA